MSDKMTVKDLKELLTHYNDDDIVVIGTGSWTDNTVYEDVAFAYPITKEELMTGRYKYNYDPEDLPLLPKQFLVIE